MFSAMREFLIKFPLVLLMVVGAFAFAGGIYGGTRLDSSSRAAFVVVGLVLLFGPWAILRRAFRGKG